MQKEGVGGTGKGEVDVKVTLFLCKLKGAEISVAYLKS